MYPSNWRTSLADFKLLVLLPATIIGLIQVNEENRLSARLAFEKTVEIAKSTAEVSRILYPDGDEEEVRNSPSYLTSA